MASEAERAMPPRAQVCYDDLLMDAKPVDPMEEARKAAKKRHAARLPPQGHTLHTPSQFPGRVLWLSSSLTSFMKEGMKESMISKLPRWTARHGRCDRGHRW